MSIFDIDYINTVWNLLLPPSKRLSKWFSWGAAVMSAKQWWHNSIFTTWMQGDYGEAAYNPTAGYSSGNRILYSVQSYSAGYTGANAYYGDNGIYEALVINADGSINGGGMPAGIAPVGNNIAPASMPSNILNSAQAIAWLYNYSVNYPLWQAKNYIVGQIVNYSVTGYAYTCVLNTTSSQAPSNVTYWKIIGRPGCLWVRVSANFIGANERASYSCQKLIYEFALNRWFSTTFRQPIIGRSDIYINVNAVSLNRMYFFPNPNQSFFTTKTNLPPTQAPITSYFFPSGAFTPQNDFTIYVPLLVYNALSPSAGLRDGVVRAFADKLCPAGAFYNVLTY